MTWQEAMQVVAVERNNPRYAELCDDSRSDHLYWRGRVIEMAGGPAVNRAPTVQTFPGVRAQAVNFWRTVKAFVKSGGKLATKAERARRQSICQVCPFWSGSRCRKCGCTSLKSYAAAAVCPDFPPRWGLIEPPAE